MNIEQIKARAPEGSMYWSPAINQYFDKNFLNITFKKQGKLVHVSSEHRNDLVLLYGIISNTKAMNKPHIATYYYVPVSGYIGEIRGYGVWSCRNDYLEGKAPMKRAISLAKLTEYWGV